MEFFSILTAKKPVPIFFLIIKTVGMQYMGLGNINVFIIINYT